MLRAWLGLSPTSTCPTAGAQPWREARRGWRSEGRGVGHRAEQAAAVCVFGHFSRVHLLDPID